ncbi:MAG: CehA/McbA family metallohydrolase [Clostridium celatum]|nr:CehA/McbA family metallohydrolase [Clostridium celatum]
MKSKRLIALVIAATMTTGLATFPTESVKAEKALNVVISEIYGGGGNTGATLKNDFIELYNPTGEEIDITGWKVQYASKTGEFGKNETELTGKIKAGGYYLIKQAAGSNGTEELEHYDAEGNIAMAGAECKVRIVNANNEVIDLVGVGSSANLSETAPTVAMSSTTSVQRRDNLGGESGETNGWDTNNNSADFYAAEPTPRSSMYEVEEEIEGVTSIKNARELADKEEVTIRGVVSFNDRNQTLHIQDKSGAIAISNYSSKIDFSQIVVGDEVEITGTLDTFNKLRQVQATELEVIAKKTAPTPKEVTIKELKEKNYDSYYVEIKGAVLDTTAKTLTQGDNVLDIYFIPSGLEVQTGDTVDVVGTVGRYGDTVQIYGSSCTFTKVEVETPDVPEEPEVDKVGPTIVKVTPGNSANVGDNRRPEITATFEDESGVDMESVKMVFDGKDITSALVKEENTVKYTVSEDLEDGRHTVKVEVKDTLGNITTKEWRFTVGKQETNLYFGQLHSHTNLSDGQGTIDEAYTYAKNIAGVDFVAVTDHSNWFDNDTAANMGDGSASEEWQLGLATADKYNKDGEFTAIYGYEMTWSGSTGGYGHINTFNTPGFETRTNKNMNLKNYYETLKQYPESLSQLNHPGKTFGNFSDYAHYDAAIDEVVTLIEVGNGEGAIRSSGYFPSYEEYTRALDKGWHVSPTNNQDNHKGKWGNANTARTVVEASELTREAIYEAISERRTYATEDENLRISYTVNGNPMGSILDDTGSLEFNISVEDIDSGDNIKKISIIGDGGKVVKSIDNINSTTKDWSFTLDNNVSSYYYVRVDQADQDIAVTAPVWVGERENVGIESIDCDTELVVENEEISIDTTVYNNEATELTDVKVEYYVDGATDPEVVTIEKIESATAGKATFIHRFEKAGEHKIDVVVKANINGNEREFKGSIEIKVSKASAVSKVVIDGAHQNQYVSGDYSGKITTLTGLMTQNGIKSVINKEPITDEVLEGASLLILSDPQSTTKDSVGLTPQKYTEDELKAIAKFAENGGNIIITSKADYGDGVGEYGNAAQGNSVLEAIGAKIRFNDDQATDDVENGGQSYRLYFNDYNTESAWLEDVDTSKNYSFYSGSTLIMPEDTNNVEVLVRGHETTYGNDADKQGDATPIEQGDVVGLAVETLESGAKVFVSGATFFSDFEIDGYVYSNFDITSKVLRELAPTPELPVSKIADVRVDLDGDNNPDRFGETVVVEGYVTAASNAAAPGNSFFDVIYIQDETAGLTVFGVSSTEVKLGQKVKLTGKVSSYLGDAQIALNNESYDLEIIDENINLVAPTKLSTADSMLEEKEGLLVQVSGTVTRIEGQNIYVNDGSGESRVYTEGYIRSSQNPSVADEWKSRIKVGDNVSAIGLASEDPEGHRLRVRDSAEIVVLAEDKVDEEAIEKVEELISKLPEISNITLNDKHGVAAARAAYNALTAEEKALVSEKFVKMLEEAEARIAELEKEESEENKPQTPGVEVKPEDETTNGNGNGTTDNEVSGGNTSKPGNSLPNTGGTNTIYVVFGALVLVAAGAFALFKKKKK